MVFFAKVLYDTLMGGYIKVTGTTVTSANIAAECAKIYSVIPPEKILIQYHQLLFMLKSVKQLIRIANNQLVLLNKFCLILLQMILNVITMELRYFIPAPIANMAYSKKISSILDRFN
jgi:hypothetical protein